MFRIVRLAIVLSACLSLCGGWAGMLQAVAWGRMLADYSRQAGIAEGAKMTFDGEHPCEMCKALAESRRTERSGKEQPLRTPCDPLAKHFLPAGNLVAPPLRGRDLAVMGFAAPLPVSPKLKDGPPLPPPRGENVRFV